MIVYLNGDFVGGARAIGADDRGLLLGHGAFETIYVEDGACAFLEAHLERLERSLAAVGISFDLLRDWRGIARALAKKNDVAGRASLRLTATAGPGGRGLGAHGSPTILASLAPLGDLPRLWKVAVARPTRSSASIAARHKLIGGYVDNLAALAEARGAGAEEAIMLNERGDVACASVANVFSIDPDGAAATPRIEDGALPGIVRGLLLKGDHGVKVAERAIAPEAMTAGAAFLTNSLRGVAACAGGEISASATRTLETLQSWYDDVLARELRRG